MIYYIYRFMMIYVSYMWIIRRHSKLGIDHGLCAGICVCAAKVRRAKHCWPLSKRSWSATPRRIQKTGFGRISSTEWSPLKPLRILCSGSEFIFFRHRRTAFSVPSPGNCWLFFCSIGGVQQVCGHVARTTNCVTMNLLLPGFPSVQWSMLWPLQPGYMLFVYIYIYIYISTVTYRYVNRYMHISI